MTMQTLLDIAPRSQGHKRFRRATRPGPQRRRRLVLEPLENRLLLHGGDGLDDPLPMLDNGQDLLVDVQLAALLGPSVSDAAGSLPESLTEVAADTTFYIEVWVQDIHSNVGITGGSVDLSYTTAAADAQALYHGSTFTFSKSGTIDDPASLVTNFGGGTLTGGLGVAPNWARLGYVQYQATAEQPILFALAPGTLQFSLFTKGNVPVAQTNFGTLALNYAQQNESPVADAGGPYIVAEGSGVTLDGSGSTDPNAAYGDHIVEWKWDLDDDGEFDDGDGEQLELTPDAMRNLGLGDGPAERTIRLRVRDSFGATGEAETTIYVTNEPPNVAVPIDVPPVNEGTLFELPSITFTDPGWGDTHTATIDWGDGSLVEPAEVFPPVNGSPGQVHGSHVYADNGTYHVTVRVRDDDMTDPEWWVESFFDVFVENVLPFNVQVNLSSTTINEGDSVTLNGAFEDPGTLDTHVVTVYWGDGDSSTIELAAEVYAFSATHTYLDNATGTAASDFWISVSVIDKDFLPPVSEPPGASNFEFSQLSWYDAEGDLVVPNSSWGTFTADVVGDPDQVVYLNVAAAAGGDAAWIVQNMPIFADLTNAGADFDISLLGVPSGTALASLEFVFTVDNSIRTTMPSGTMTTATVAALEYHPCGDAELGQPSVPADVGRPAGIRIDTEITNEIQHPGVPGVQEGVNQCLAGATARSIAWLNTRYNLGSPKSAQEIYEDTKALNTGTYAERLAGIAGYLSNLAAASGATASTKVLTAPGISVGNPAGVTLVTGQDMKAWIRGELQRGEDVTLDYDTHIVTVTGTYDAGDKTFLKYRDDENQRTNAFGDAGVKMGELSQDGDGNWQFRPAGSNSFFKVRLAMSESVYRAKVTVNNLPPTILSVTNSGPVDAGTPVSVTITASDPAGVNDDPLTYEWDWDNDGTYDDSSVSTNVASYTYANDGTYTVGVRVTDHDGAWATSSTVVTVYDNRPFASFAADPNPSACNQTVTFDASGSSHGRPDRAIVSYEWDFDYDGLTFTPDATGVTATHSYSTFRTYTVGLRVTDDNDPAKTAESFFDVFVTLGNLPPVAVPGGPYSIEEGADLTLDGSGSTDPNASCGDRIVTYEWDLGNDGTYEFTHTEAELAVAWAELSSLPRNTNIPLALRVTDTFDLTHTATTTLNIHVNRAPTHISLNPNWVLDNTAEAVVGNVTVTDPDLPADTHTFEISDDRFEIVDGKLKLKAGEALQRAVEPTVTLDITATDSGGLSLTVEFTLVVLDPTQASVSWRFDFNGFHGYTALGYIGVPPWQQKAGNPYGWQTLPPRYFERNWPVAPPYHDDDEGKLKYDGHETDRAGSPMTFEVDVPAGLQYEVMILTGDTLWRHDQQQFSVYDPHHPTGARATQVVDCLGGAEVPGNTVWGGGTPNSTGAFYRWLRFTTDSIVPVSNGMGTLLMTMRDLGGADATAVILAMDIRPVSEVQPIVITPFAEPLSADGVTVDTYSGTGAPPNTVLTVTAFASSTLAPPADNSYYLKIEGMTAPADRDVTLFGTQIMSGPDGTFQFQATRSALTAPVTMTVQESSGLARGTLVQEYIAPPDDTAPPLRFDFGVSNSPVQDDWLQVHPRITYNASRGYGWTTRVAAVDRQPGSDYSAMRRDLNYARQGTFRVDLPDGTYSVRIYHANPRYYGRHNTVHDNFRVTLGNRQYEVGRIEPGESYVWSGSVMVSGGSLFIHLQDFGGVDGNFIISGLEISAGTLPDETPSQAVGDPLDSGATTITMSDLAPVAAEAAARWSATGLSAGQAAALDQARFVIQDLGGAYLALANPATHVIRIDDDAAHFGWSLATGHSSLAMGQMTNDEGPMTNDGVDLLTVVMHELGHLLGYGHSDDPHDLMAPMLQVSAPYAGSVSGHDSSSHLEPLSATFPSLRDELFTRLLRDDAEEPLAALAESSADDLLAARTAKPGGRAAEARVPRRSRMERYERELDAWFDLLACEDGEEATGD